MKTHGYIWKTRLLPKQGEICFYGKSVWGEMLSHLLASSNVAHALSDQSRVKVLCNAREGKFYLSTTTEKRMQQSTKETCNGKAANATTKANSHSICYSELGSTGWYVCIRRFEAECQNDRSLGHVAKQHRA